MADMGDLLSSARHRLEPPRGRSEDHNRTFFVLARGLHSHHPFETESPSADSEDLNG